MTASKLNKKNLSDKYHSTWVYKNIWCRDHPNELEIFILFINKDIKI